MSRNVGRAIKAQRRCDRLGRNAELCGYRPLARAPTGGSFGSEVIVVGYVLRTIGDGARSAPYRRSIRILRHRGNRPICLK